MVLTCNCSFSLGGCCRSLWNVIQSQRAKCRLSDHPRALTTGEQGALEVKVSRLQHLTESSYGEKLTNMGALYSLYLNTMYTSFQMFSNVLIWHKQLKKLTHILYKIIKSTTQILLVPRKKILWILAHHITLGLIAGENGLKTFWHAQVGNMPICCGHLFCTSCLFTGGYPTWAQPDLLWLDGLGHVWTMI